MLEGTRLGTHEALAAGEGKAKAERGERGETEKEKKRERDRRLCEVSFSNFVQCFLPTTEKKRMMRGEGKVQC